MPAPKGNRFWEKVSSAGRKPLFASPDDLWKACIEYFEWVEDNPLWESKPFQHQGVVIENPIAKMRAMTVGGLCIFLDIAVNTWYEYGKREGFKEVTTRVTEIIRDQKFTGAAADLLNPVIIARDLGLRDKAEFEHTGPNGGPIETKEVSTEEAAKRILFLLSSQLHKQEKQE